MTSRSDARLENSSGAVPEIVDLPWNRAIAEDAVGVPAQRRVPAVETEDEPVTSEAATKPSTEPAIESVEPFESVEPSTPGLVASTDLDVAGTGISEDHPDEDQPAEDPATSASGESEEPDAWPSPRRQIAHAVRLLCALIAVILLGHRLIPNFMGFGSMLDTFLPWTFVPLLVALPAAVASRSRWAMGVAALAVCVWGADFGPTLLPRGASGPSDLRILSQNISAQTPDLAAEAALAVKEHADVVVLGGMSAGGVQASAAAVPAGYKYHLALYEFSVWSKYPLSPGQPVDLGARVPGASTGGRTGDSGLFGGLLSFNVTVPGRPQVTVYAVHLPQPALTHSGFAVVRDNALANLVAQIRGEKSRQLVVVGDLDLAQTDRGMQQLLDTGLVSTQAEAGDGFGFTWPAQFPMVRLDDALVRGLTPVRSLVLGATGTKQAHRPIETDLKF